MRTDQALSNAEEQRSKFGNLVNGGRSKKIPEAMACETLILRKYFTHHGKIRLIYSVAGHAYGPAHEARLVQLTVGAAKEQTAREYR